MKYLAFPLLLAVAPVSSDQEECPSSVTLKVKGISDADASNARKYAACVGIPWLPTKGESAKRLEKCKSLRLATSRKHLKQAFDWVDHVVVTLSGCETNLRISK